MRASRSRSEGMMIVMVSREVRWALQAPVGYHLGASLGEKIVDEGCNFKGEVSNMQTTDRFDAGATPMARPSRSPSVPADGWTSAGGGRVIPAGTSAGKSIFRSI